MKFAKDILVIDFETTGIDLINSNPIQLGAVLLDKETLEEKDSYSSFIYTDEDLSDVKIRDWDMPIEEIKKAPKIDQVAKEFTEKFGPDVMISSWVYYLDRAMLEKLLGSIGLKLRHYDYHVLDLWPIGYAHLLKKGYDGSMRSDDMFAAFGLPKREGQHDGLEDSRLAADILRKVMSEK